MIIIAKIGLGAQQCNISLSHGPVEYIHLLYPILGETMENLWKILVFEFSLC